MFVLNVVGVNHDVLYKNKHKCSKTYVCNMSRPIRRLLVFHKLKVVIETMSEEYPIVLVQDSYSPHIRIPRFVDHRLSNNPLV